MQLGVGHRLLEPYFRAVVFLQPDVGDADIEREQIRFRVYLGALAVSRDGGIRHFRVVVYGAEHIVDGVGQAVVVVHFLRCLDIAQGVFHVALGVVRESDFVLDQRVFRFELFGFLVLGDGRIVLALVMELGALGDKAACVGQGENRGGENEECDAFHELVLDEVGIEVAEIFPAVVRCGGAFFQGP